MESYCTVQDVRNVLSPGGVDAQQETAASLPDFQILDAIRDAQSRVNMYLAGRYLVPLEDYLEAVDPTKPDDEKITVRAAPAPVRSWTRDIAAYLASLTFNRGRDLSEDDPIRLRFALVERSLIEVRDSAMDLDLPPREATDTGGIALNLYDGTLFGPSDFGLSYNGYNPQVLLPGSHW